MFQNNYCLEIDLNFFIGFRYSVKSRRGSDKSPYTYNGKKLLCCFDDPNKGIGFQTGAANQTAINIGLTK